MFYIDNKCLASIWFNSTFLLKLQCCSRAHFAMCIAKVVHSRLFSRQTRYIAIAHAKVVILVYFSLYVFQL